MPRRHDVAAAGWRVGDMIGVAPTQMLGKGAGERFAITAIATGASLGAGSVVTLGGSLAADKLGKTSTMGGRRVHLAAEVVLLTRSVEVTGSAFTSETSVHSKGVAVPQGLHVIQAGSGAMHISHTRVSKCGQRGHLGRYCLHFHHMGSCPQCVFEGNAVEDGEQRGITVHSTHNATVRTDTVSFAPAVCLVLLFF